MAAIALAGLLAGAPPAAERPAERAARRHVGATDLGGVVTGPNGPEAGVWVIAETTDLPTNSARSSSPTTTAASSSPICRRPNTRSGCAAMASSTRPRSTASRADAQPHRRARARREGGRALLSADLLVRDAEGAGRRSFPARARQVDGIADMKSQPMAEQDQDHRLHVVPRARHRGNAHDLEGVGQFKNSADAWKRRIQSGRP